MEVYRKKNAEDLKQELKWALSALDSLEELTKSIDFEYGIKLTGHGMASIQSIAVATTKAISHALEYLEAHTEENEADEVQAGDPDVEIERGREVDVEDA